MFRLASSIQGVCNGGLLSLRLAAITRPNVRPYLPCFRYYSSTRTYLINCSKFKTSFGVFSNVGRGFPAVRINSRFFSNIQKEIVSKNGTNVNSSVKKTLKKPDAYRLLSLGKPETVHLVGKLGALMQSIVMSS